MDAVCRLHRPLPGRAAGAQRRHLSPATVFTPCATLPCACPGSASCWKTWNPVLRARPTRRFARRWPISTQQVLRGGVCRPAHARWRRQCAHQYPGELRRLRHAANRTPAVARIMELARGLNGVISGEHGIGITKLEFLHRRRNRPVCRLQSNRLTRKATSTRASCCRAPTCATPTPQL